MIKHFASQDGLQLAYRDEGAGLPVICLAGLTRNGTDFDDLVTHLPDVRIIRLDSRGRGASEWDPDPAHYSVSVEARDVVALMDHLTLPSACFIGTSRGGLVTMALAMNANDRVAGFVFNDIGPRIERHGLERIADWIGKNPLAGDFEECAHHLAANSPGFAHVPHKRWVQEARRRYRQTDEGLVINYDPGLRTSFLGSISDGLPELWDLFARLADRPGAVIRGANSDILARATVDAMIDVMPELLAADIPDRGHCPFLDEPEALSAIGTILNRLA